MSEERPQSGLKAKGLNPQANKLLPLVNYSHTLKKPYQSIRSLKEDMTQYTSAPLEAKFSPHFEQNFAPSRKFS